MRSWNRPFYARVITITRTLDTTVSRLFTTRSHQRVAVPCRSSGHVILDLFNMAESHPSTPLIVYFPPFSSPNGTLPQSLPDFCEDYPVASINYRWRQNKASSVSTLGIATPLQWPCPSHDTAFAYEWIKENLAPEEPLKRDVFVYGSFLGASLAMSLALNESYIEESFGVKGVAVYNGIYDWTMFVPNHPLHRKLLEEVGQEALLNHRICYGKHMENFQAAMPELFDRGEDVFDPFASPSLFFHNTRYSTFSSIAKHLNDQHKPPSNWDQAFQKEAESALSEEEAFEKLLEKKKEDQPEEEFYKQKPPKEKKGYSVKFPDEDTDLVIPHTLLLHDASPSSSKSVDEPHTLEHQAEDLAPRLQDSFYDFLKNIDRYEFHGDQWELRRAYRRNPDQRVQIIQVGKEIEGTAMSKAGQDEVRMWIRRLAYPEQDE